MDKSSCARVNALAPGATPAASSSLVRLSRGSGPATARSAGGRFLRSCDDPYVDRIGLDAQRRRLSFRNTETLVYDRETDGAAGILGVMRRRRREPRDGPGTGTGQRGASGYLSPSAATARYDTRRMSRASSGTRSRKYAMASGSTFDSITATLLALASQPKLTSESPSGPTTPS